MKGILKLVNAEESVTRAILISIITYLQIESFNNVRECPNKSKYVF